MVAQKFHFAILRIEVTRASRGLCDSWATCCTAHGRQSLYFTTGDLNPHLSLIHGSLGPPKSSTQTVWSVQPLLQSSLLLQTDRPHYSVC